LATTIAAIAVFAIALWWAIASLGAIEESVSRLPDAPDSLVSAGAPRSQLELKRMFESMSLTYVENGKTVCEPISAEYRRATEEKIEAGETPALSVEEVLFIVADTPQLYEKVDVIRLRGADGSVEREILTGGVRESVEKAFHRAAFDRIANIMLVIEYRIGALSTPDSFGYDGEGRKYYEPRESERNDGKTYSAGGRFVFGLYGGNADPERAMVYVSDGGKDVILYPSANEAALCRTKVILQNQRGRTSRERELLALAGYSPDRCKNITPLYWYAETDVRLFAFGSLVVIIDPEGDGRATLLPEGTKLISAAIGDVVYLTVASDNGSDLLRYADGLLETLLSTDEEYIAVCESLVGEYGDVSVYKATRFEDERFVIALECGGDPIAEYKADRN
jgi:hypothetical protein